jgi:hypothetical protein
MREAPTAQSIAAGCAAAGSAAPEGGSGGETCKVWIRWDGAGEAGPVRITPGL